MATLEKSRCMVASDDAAILGLIRGQGVELTIWERSLLPALEAWLVTLDLSAIGQIRFDLEPTGMRGSIMKNLISAGYPAGASLDLFADDIMMIVKTFVGVTDADLLDFRLEVVTTDACRKFHADYVSVRLITTYAGQATQWIDGMPSPEIEVQQMRAGDVGLFKGRLAVAAPRILHRSPPIADTGERRLLLVLNPERREIYADDVKPR